MLDDGDAANQTVHSDSRWIGAALPHVCLPAGSSVSDVVRVFRRRKLHNAQWTHIRHISALNVRDGMKSLWFCHLLKKVC